jgi:hypothetical protein
MHCEPLAKKHFFVMDPFFISSFKIIRIGLCNIYILDAYEIILQDYWDLDSVHLLVSQKTLKDMTLWKLDLFPSWGWGWGEYTYSVRYIR